MPLYELERENNIARNKETLVSLGLDKPAAVWGGADTAGAPTGTKRKGAGRKGRKAKKKTKGALESDDDDEGEEEEEEEEEGSEGEDVPLAARAPRVPRVTTKPPPAPKEWAVKARAFLEDADRGAQWKALVGLWWAREASKGFASPTKSHPAKKRPQEVKDWIQRARRYTPEIADAEAFGEVWWDWWTDISPKWRTTTTPMGRNGPGDWDCLDYAGQNGFLNILACLKWWFDKDAASRRWGEAVDDVTWVLRQMNG
ncbi:hypothetical protein B0H11DRAFT_1723526 [Mycena galericulata]|nr:hypothetical protein B0H11DRAFT_1738403 [Mycena galericulata]KAJ7482918.1 hypothetical protein B0H11DRAFT_1723526 [Mycena galericulata]